MRFWSLVFIAIFISACTKQSKVEVLHSFKNGKPNTQKYFPDDRDTSYYIKQWFYPSGDTSATLEYRYGISNGNLRCYFENGVLQRTVQIVGDSLFNGVMIERYETGVLRASIFYKDNLRDGPYYLFDECGQMEVRTHYKNDVEDGIYSIWHPNGVLELSVEVKDGKEHGRKLSFYSNQNLHIISNYVNDTIHGTYLKCYPNGCTKEKGMVNKKKRVDTWYYWNEDGSFRDSVVENGEKEFY